MENNTPEYYMGRALLLAEKGRFTVSPNPMVGCVIVKNGQIIGTGFHQRAGEPHAEVFALKAAGDDACDADVYVTLEPCCHYGRTPPCTEALVQAGVKRVFIACQDVNPLVASQGVRQLQAAGIETMVGVKEQEARQLNKVFFHYMTHKRPFVIAKWAMSLDGKTITHPDDDRVISDAACHAHAHGVRHAVDAILIGSRTACMDNPQLTVRYQTEVKQQPLRIVLASQGQLPLDLALFSPDLPGKTCVAVTELADKQWMEQAKKNNIECWVLPVNDQQQVDLSALLKKLGEQHVTSLLVEGGECVRNRFLRDNLVDEMLVYISPVFIGDLSQKKSLNIFQYQSLGASLCLTASLKP